MVEYFLRSSSRSLARVWFAGLRTLGLLFSDLPQRLHRHEVVSLGRAWKSGTTSYDTTLLTSSVRHRHHCGL
eukprot:4811898-Pyramimonas_sp.AAC.1